MLEVIEVQTGSYLGEDDIVRFDDTYGRCPAAEKREALALQAALQPAAERGVDAPA